MSSFDLNLINFNTIKVQINQISENLQQHEKQFKIKKYKNDTYIKYHSDAMYFEELLNKIINSFNNEQIIKQLYKEIDYFIWNEDKYMRYFLMDDLCVVEKYVLLPKTENIKLFDYIFNELDINFIDETIKICNFEFVKPNEE